MAKDKLDKELEQYRGLLETPDEFENGFGWTTVAGIFFCGLVMMPGSIYLGLMTGGSMGPAAVWVTVILFSEISRRAMKTMSKGNLIVLLHAAGVMMAANVMFPGGPFGSVIYRAFLVTSDSARDMGMTNSFPSWFAPDPNSPAILERNLLHMDWFIPIALILFISFIGLIKRYTLGYFFFRLCSDIEQLPYPMAPIQAQGALALAEADKTEDEINDELEEAEKKGKKSFSKWRMFSLGSLIGISFGGLQIGVPAITGLFLDKPIFLIPQPWIETTQLTENILPATPTGFVFDIGIILLGFVLPFWSVVGTLIAILVTMIMNPILHSMGILTQWQEGMDTINTTFVNGVDFWMSFGIGTAAGIAVISIYSTTRDVIKRTREAALAKKTNAADRKANTSSLWETPDLGRGDYPMWIALLGYAFAGGLMIWVCHILVPGIFWFLVVFTFVYNPFISYVNARLMGISGQSVDIPFVREGAFILSGCKSLDIWLAPVPIENYGGQAQSYRINELTGVNFFSLLKADLVTVPLLFVFSLCFWAFIWKSNAVPSDMFPSAQLHWELAAKNQTLLFSSTFVPEGVDPDTHSFADSEFAKALHPKVIGIGAGVTVSLFAIFSWVGLPTMLIYGMIRGFGNMPHVMILEIIGALIGRYYFQKKYGADNFLRMAPTIMAGFMTGVGLIGMATIAMTLIKNAISSAPF
ncbi:OPT/YSL family transporter [bacterium AH-315-E10]|nr:OPT/YSL family transporter [bacterium AH-315-E10]